jgi:hypothetical protein
VGTVLRRQDELIAKNHTMELTGVVIRDGRTHGDATDPHDPVLELMQDAADVVVLIRNSGAFCGEDENQDDRQNKFRFHL